MAELKWTNVDGGNLNQATNVLVNTNNIMYDRVKDLNQVAQSHLNNMQKGIDDRFSFDREQNTQQILNQMNNVDTLEGLKQNQELANGDALLSRFGSRVDLSKINSAKSSWASDALNRNTAKDSLKDSTEHAQKVKAQIEFLSNSGQHQKAMELLERNAGVFSNKLSETLNTNVRKAYEYDAKYALDARLTDAQVNQANASANKLNADAEHSKSNTKFLNIDNHNKNIKYFNEESLKNYQEAQKYSNIANQDMSARFASYANLKNDSTNRKIQNYFMNLQKTGNVEEFKNNIYNALVAEDTDKLPADKLIAKGIELIATQKDAIDRLKFLQEEQASLERTRKDTIDAATFNSSQVSSSNRDQSVSSTNGTPTNINNNSSNVIKRETGSYTIGEVNKNFGFKNQVNKSDTSNNTNIDPKQQQSQQSQQEILFLNSSTFPVFCKFIK